ncbi:MAG: hypothetical protein Q9183_005149, partial [Haloplaca sp. 2 TL-2023]
MPWRYRFNIENTSTGRQGGLYSDPRANARAANEAALASASRVVLRIHAQPDQHVVWYDDLGGGEMVYRLLMTTATYLAYIYVFQEPADDSVKGVQPSSVDEEDGNLDKQD